MPQSNAEQLEDFVQVCSLEDVPRPIPRRVEIDGRGILICRDGDEVFAIDEICPHRNQSMQRAPLVQGEIVCPHHQYRFDLRTGSCNRRCAPVETYEVEVVDGQVWVRT